MTYKILKTTLKRSDFIGEYEDIDTAKQVKRFEEERGEGIITIVPSNYTTKCNKSQSQSSYK